MKLTENQMKKLVMETAKRVLNTINEGYYDSNDNTNGSTFLDACGHEIESNRKLKAYAEYLYAQMEEVADELREKGATDFYYTWEGLNFHWEPEEPEDYYDDDDSFIEGGEEFQKEPFNAHESAMETLWDICRMEHSDLFGDYRHQDRNKWWSDESYDWILKYSDKVEEFIDSTATRHIR